eukprot:scaffold317233_cov46-Attheya_sp.AAC.2
MKKNSGICIGIGWRVVDICTLVHGGVHCTDACQFGLSSDARQTQQFNMKKDLRKACCAGKEPQKRSVPNGQN